MRRLDVPCRSSWSDVEQMALLPRKSTLRYANIAMKTDEYVGHDIAISVMSEAKSATPAAAVAMVTMPRHIVFQWRSHSWLSGILRLFGLRFSLTFADAVTVAPPGDPCGVTAGRNHQKDAASHPRDHVGVF